MSDLDTFTQLPLQIDPQSKQISSPSSRSTAAPAEAPPSSRALQTELDALNTMHRALLQMETPFPFPPPPVPVHPKRSSTVAKFRDTGNDLVRKNKPEEAIKHYTLGLQAALARPLWEPSQLCREEVAMLYANRAQAYISMRAWPEGCVDAEASVEAKKIGNAKAWWRRGKCLLEMGRLEEARDWVKRGLELEGEEKDMVELMKEIDGKIETGK